jgi:hypothetical protein
MSSSVIIPVSHRRCYGGVATVKGAGGCYEEIPMTKRMDFKRRLGGLALAAVLLIPVAVSAQTQRAPHTPARGSPERKAIVDALRLPVSRMLKGPVAFAISHLKVDRKWALLIAVPRRPTGEAIDYSDTKWAEAVRRQEFKDEIVALMRQRGVRWRVVWYVIGATEPPWRDWAKRYKAPPGIFPRIPKGSAFDR